MRTIRLLMTFAVLLAGGARSTMARDKFFNTQDGEWNNGNNWYPSGVPEAQDKAIIQTGQTCRIQGTVYAALALSIDVQSGALLTIEATNCLWIGGDTPPASTVNGTLRFEHAEQGANPPLLKFRMPEDGSLAMNGSGTITTYSADASPAGNFELI